MASSVIIYTIVILYTKTLSTFLTSWQHYLASKAREEESGDNTDHLSVFCVYCLEIAVL